MKHVDDTIILESRESGVRWLPYVTNPFVYDDILHKAMNPPQAPDSLPKYLAEGIPKQDDSMIEDLREYSQAILEHCQQTRAETEVTAEDIPSNAEQLGTDESGTFVAETVTCGDQSCGYMKR
jgi:hypothetical protein